MFSYNFRLTVWLISIFNKCLSSSSLDPDLKIIIEDSKKLLYEYSLTINAGMSKSLTSFSEGELNMSYNSKLFQKQLKKE